MGYFSCSRTVFADRSIVFFGVYEALLAELDAAFPSRDSRITGEVTQNLPYFNVIDESMRVVPLIAGGELDFPPTPAGVLMRKDSLSLTQLQTRPRAYNNSANILRWLRNTAECGWHPGSCTL